MEPQTDPVSMWITGGGGLGGGALGGYIISRLMQQNGNGSNSKSTNEETMRGLDKIADRLDHTNELLNELLRQIARLEGLLQPRGSER